MIKYVKDILLYKVGQKLEIYNQEEVKQIEELSKKATKDELINIIYKLSELENKMKWSSQKTIIFQTEIIKLCVKQEPKVIINEEIKPKQVTKVKEEEPMQKVEKRVEVEAKPKQEVQSKKLEKGENIKNWSNVLSDLKKQGKVILYANLINTEAVKVNDMTVEIRFHSGLNEFRKELLKKPENFSVLEKEVALMCQKPMHIKFEDATGSAPIAPKAIKTEAPKKEQNTEDIINEFDIPINYIEEE